MGYTTEFRGAFELDKPLTPTVQAALVAMSSTRQTTGSLDGYCQWVPTDDGRGIIWDGGEKFYDYVPWIKHIIARYLIPGGYVLNGEVRFRGEDFDDTGTICVKNNVVTVTP